MTVHNILEEEVIERVSNIYNQAKEQGVAWLTCDCEQCRLDTATYVLNRIPPKYIVSGRGMNHNVSSTDAQQKADMDSLIFEAMRIVSSVQRPFHAQNNEEDSKDEIGEFYNFPTFIGSVFDGDTFEPLENANITLKMNDEIAPMLDHTWTNPCTTTKSTKATYSFWVKPQQAKDKSCIYKFTLEIRADGYDTITYAFEIPVMKEYRAKKSLNSTYSLKIQDLFLFKKI